MLRFLRVLPLKKWKILLASLHPNLFRACTRHSYSASGRRSLTIQFFRWLNNSELKNEKHQDYNWIQKFKSSRFSLQRKLDISYHLARVASPGMMTFVQSPPPCKKLCPSSNYKQKILNYFYFRKNITSRFHFYRIYIIYCCQIYTMIPYLS